MCSICGGASNRNKVRATPVDPIINVEEANVEEIEPYCDRCRCQPDAAGHCPGAGRWGIGQRIYGRSSLRQPDRHTKRRFGGRRHDGSERRSGRSRKCWRKQQFGERSERHRQCFEGPATAQFVQFADEPEVSHSRGNRLPSRLFASRRRNPPLHHPQMDCGDSAPIFPRTPSPRRIKCSITVIWLRRVLARITIESSSG
jgi:hypothetical protein